MLRFGQRSKIGLKSCIFTLPFILTLAYFCSVDVYDWGFFVAGTTGAYNVFRTIFTVYLLGIICVPGAMALAAIGGAAAFAALSPLARLAASFFCGAALWHGLLLILGFLDLYIYPIAVALGILTVALTPACLGTTAFELLRGARNALRDQSWIVASANVVLASAALAAAFLLLIVKGLYPAGGHDYFNHYHQYYETVLRTHGIWPNEVWFQFFYSKGMGLFFLSMLLTDPLAPSIVTFCFAVGSSIALFY
jgi:hypothetical protein